jgi:hypothetical protein
MLRLLSEFLYSTSDFFQHERRQKIVIISVFGLLIVCIWSSMARSAVRRSNASESPAASPTWVAPTSIQTKWWVKHERSETPTSSLASPQIPIVDTGPTIALNNCPAYAADFKPGAFGYISLFPPYENIIRSGAGTNYSAVGFIEIGGWVKILTKPVCADDGYVWLNVESAAGSSNWTAGGHKAAQWVIPCPDPIRTAVRTIQPDQCFQPRIPIATVTNMTMITIQLHAYPTSSPLVSMHRLALMTC